MDLVVRSWSRDSRAPALLGRKQVDWSIFEYGTHIPLEFHAFFTTANGGVRLARGDRVDITLVIHGVPYKAALVNFDRHDTDIDSLQIRYDTNRALQGLLRETFCASHEYLIGHRKLVHVERARVHIRVPDDKAEYIELYATNVPYVYQVSLVRQMQSPLSAPSHSDEGTAERDVEHAIEALDDQEFADWLASADGSARLELRQKIARVRQYHRSVIWRLKQRYQGKCQLCGWSSLEDFGVDISEAHHIDYFSRTLNNSPSNIAILCPSHHTLVHAIHATFDRTEKAFVSAGDYRLQLQANYHL